MIIQHVTVVCDGCGVRTEATVENLKLKLPAPWGLIRHVVGIIVRPGTSGKPDPDKHFCSKACGLATKAVADKKLEEERDRWDAIREKEEEEAARQG